MVYYVNNYGTGAYPFTSIATAASSFHELFETLGGELADMDVIKVVKLVTDGIETPMVEVDPAEILIAYRNGITIQGCDMSNTTLGGWDYATVEMSQYYPLFKFYKCSNVTIKNVKFRKRAID